MIAVWIVAVTFTLVGALYSFPKYYKLFTCRSCTIGRILESRSALGTDQKGITATYEYMVDGVRYEGRTGWTTFGVFRRNRDYTVHYNQKKPQRSYISGS